MQDGKEYKSGIKTFLILVAAIREHAVRAGEDPHEVDRITMDALKECLDEAPVWSEDRFEIMLTRTRLTIDFLEQIVAGHVAEKLFTQHLAEKILAGDEEDEREGGNNGDYS